MSAGEYSDGISPVEKESQGSIFWIFIKIPRDGVRDPSGTLHFKPACHSALCMGINTDLEYFF